MAFNLLIKLTGHNGSIYSMINGLDDVFYSCGGDGFIVAWDKKGNNPDGLLIAKANEAIYCGHFIKDKNTIVVGTIEGNVLWIDVIEKKILYASKAHTRSIYGMAQMGNEIISCGADGNLIFHDITTRKPTMVLQVCNSSLRCIEVDVKNNKIYIGSSDKNAYILDMESKRIVSKHSLHDASIFCMKFDTDKIFTGGRDAKLKIWSLPNFENITTIEAHNSTINSIAFLQDLVITVSKDKTIKIWTKEGKIVQTIYSFDGGHINSVNKVISLNEDSKFATCGDDRQVLVFEV